MKVSELAEELGVPASAVLEQCKRIGIDASWAGAELGGGDVVVLRAELAAADAPLDLTPADAPEAPGTPEGAAAPDDPAPVDPGSSEGAPSEPVPAGPPPTSVASMPDAAGTPEAPAPTSRIPGAGAAAPASAATVARRPEADRRQTERRLDKAVRGGLAALAVAVAALVAGELLSSPFAIWSLWLLTAIAAVVALWNGNAGRRHVTTHPERYKGLGLSVLIMVLAIALIIGVGASVSAAIGDDPAADAPLGDRDSVASARWGYQRLSRIVSEGWDQPAKEAGTCWIVDDDVERDVERIEAGTDNVNCRSSHTVEVVRVYAINRDADAPYPGRDALQADAERRCGKLVADLLDPEGDGSPIEGVLFAEIPTEDGWAEADRDIGCTVITAERRGSLD